MKNYADIYLITNLINGKQYVGQTIKGYIHRWKIHCRYARIHQGKCPQLIDYVLYKYGIENFKVELLEQVSIKEKDVKEQYYIEKYDTYNNGYNVTIGGDFNPMYDEKVRKRHLQIMRSDEVRNKMSESVRKTYENKELREWFSNHSKYIWENWTEEERKKCIVGFMQYNEQHKQAVAIVDENDKVIKIFKSCSDACIYCNRPTKEAGNLLKKCDSYNKNGKRSKMYGYYWTKL